MTDNSIEVGGHLWFNHNSKAYLGGKRLDLLEHIGQTGSLSQAAKAAGMSYKSAWDALDAMNNASHQPLVESAAGGHGGGGTRLTTFGRQLVHTLRRLQVEYERFLVQVAAGISNIDNLDDANNLLRAIAMKSSARNQIKGVVTKVDRGAVNGDIVLDIGNGQEIFANITNDAIEDLQLRVGQQAFAIIKSSFVLLSPDPDIRISARNRLTGTITQLIPGAVNSEVKITLPNSKVITAIVTRDSTEALNLAIGQPCTALIKASHVIIAIE